MKIVISMETDNAAFRNSFSKAVNGILLQVQDRVNEMEEFPDKYKTPINFSLWDINGNKVGYVKFI